MAQQVVPAETVSTEPAPQVVTSRRRGRLASVPAPVWLITGLWTALLLGASVLWPMGYGYDEVSHVDMAYAYSSHPFQFYGSGQLGYATGVVNAQATLPGIPPRQPLATAAIPARSRRPSFAQLGGSVRQQGGVPNQMVQHPPLYYWTEAIVMRLPGVSSLSWDVEVWLMRLLSVAFMVPVPLMCWEAARWLLRSGRGAGAGAGDAPHHGRRLDPDRAAVLAAVLPLTIPNLVRDGASVNNDSLLILSTSVLVAMLARVVSGDLSVRTALWASASMAVALWTKGFALVLPPIVLVAYLYSWRVHHRRSEPARLVVRPLLIGAGGAAVGAAWWLRNLVDYQTVQINGYGAAFERKLYGTPANNGTLHAFVRPFITGFLKRVWAGVGIPDRPSPGPVITYGWLALLAVGLLAALVLGDTDRRRGRLVILLLVPLLTVGVVADGSFSTFRHWPLVRANQGRYLYSSIAALAAVMVVGFVRLLPKKLYSWLAPALLTLALVTNAAVWILILRSWYQPVNHKSGLAGFGDAVHGLLRWSPLPYGITLLLVFILPALTGVAAVVFTVRDARRSNRATTGPARGRPLPAET
jgi:4-amino-4-deoxy-L-arabinose transferase-like glycosyltransferase